jgi:predicted Zn finger-like uncharacterized protein
MPLTTRCRHCGRLFPVYAQQLKERRGKVACPQCGGRFDAISGLLEEAVPGTEIQQNGRGTGGSPQPATSAPADILDLQDGRPRPRRLSSAFWTLGILLLLAALVLQLGWWDRGEWLQRPRVRAFAELVCGHIGCRLELPRQTGTIEILQHSMAERQQPPEGLRLRLVLINRADVSQRLPRLQLELYGESGELTAARRFRPEEYVPDRASERGLAPGETLRPVLDLKTPPLPAAGFRVKLF